jgi:5-carboxymethyl-2-hydroxymuconate isomerase
MPHIIVEYSANIEDRLRLPTLLKALHDAGIATGIANLSGFRTRAKRRDHYRIADGDPDNGFVAIHVRVAHGRTLETREMLGKTLFDTANRHLDPLFASSPLALSLDVQEIDPVLNFKRNNIAAWMKSRDSAA